MPQPRKICRRSPEIQADDEVEVGVEEMQDEEPGDAHAADDLIAPDNRDCISDLWPFAFG